MRIARETVAEDLALWQDKFAQAADEGAAEIETRVEEIAKRMIRRNARTMGKSVLTELEASINRETAELKAAIIKIVGLADASPADKEQDVVQAVRKAGLVVKEKAQEVRTWRENYEMELQAAVTKVSESHFKILDGIRDLALQRIGMKWAWMDGITYRDWAKYHQLRERFDEWTDDLKKLVVTHPDLEKAQDAAASVEDSAMEAAQNAARELGRLKQVGFWKVAAGDSTDNFDSEAMKAAAEDSKPVEQPAEAATSSQPDEETSTSDEEVEEPTGNAVEAHEEASSVIEAEISKATSPADGPVESESVASSISESISSAIDGATHAVESTLPDAADIAEQNASTPIVLEPPQIVENATDEPEEQEPESYQDIIRSSTKESKPSVEAGSVKPALFGAAAQSVPSRKPILDDDVDIAATLSGISAAAEATYSAAVARASSHYSAAVSIVSAQIYGTPKPVHEQMLSSVSAAYSAATASASSRLGDAYVAASKGIYGTSTTQVLPTFVDWASIESVASERLREGKEWVESQYELAKIAVGLATPTPTSSTDKLYEQAKLNYYAGLGMAHARYSDFLSAASSAFSSLTATPTPTDFAGSASSIVSAASASASSVVSVASVQGSSVASVVNEKVVDSTVAAGDALADAWAVVISQVSVQVYGVATPTPWYESLYIAAGDYAAAATSGVADSAAAVSDKAGEYAGAISGKAGEYAAVVSDTATEQYDAAADYAARASAEAARQYEAVHSLVAELVYGKEPTFSESVLSRLQAAYVTAASSASSAISAASATAASVASQATEAVKETVERVKDEL